MLLSVTSSWALHGPERDSSKGLESKATILFVESLLLDFESVVVLVAAGVNFSLLTEGSDPGDEGFDLFN